MQNLQLCLIWYAHCFFHFFVTVGLVFIFRGGICSWLLHHVTPRHRERGEEGRGVSLLWRPLPFHDQDNDDVRWRNWVLWHSCWCWWADATSEVNNFNEKKILPTFSNKIMNNCLFSCSYLFLIAFVFLIIVVLMNLLNGLAVSDTGMIR